MSVPPASEAMPEDAHDRRIPVVVLTGFLGAGKTTVLRHWLQGERAARSAVLINEFGEVGLDHHLVEKVDERLVLLDSGCLCCSVQGDLVRALKRLFQQASRREISPFERVLIETTGLADPAPVVFTLMEDAFIAERYRCDGVVVAVDATHAQAQLDKHPEAVRQVAMADRLLITKCDLADASQRRQLGARLEAINASAPRLEVFNGAPPDEALDGCGLYDPADKAPDVGRWLGEVRASRQAALRPRLSGPEAWRRRPAAPAAGLATVHDAAIASHVLCFEEALDWLGFADGLGLLLQVYGERVLRVKGLLNVRHDPEPRIVQCVGHVAYPPSSLPAWPADAPFNDRRSRLVFIVRDLPRDEIVNILASFCGQAPLPPDAPTHGPAPGL